MPRFKVPGLVPVPLASGRVLVPGEVYDDVAVEKADQPLIEDGLIVKIADRSAAGGSKSNDKDA